MKTLIFLISVLLIQHNIFATDKPSSVLKSQFISDFNALSEASEKLSDLAQLKEHTWEEKMDQFFKTRIAYKKVELFMAYLDHEFVKDHINGAPLPHVERKAPNLVVLDPKGFQIMEEVLLEEDEQQFGDLARQLHAKISEFQRYLPAAKISERMVFEAMRESTIRLAAMGITGFDTPSTLNTLSECQTVMSTLNRTINAYSEYFSDKTKREIEFLFKTGQTYFQTSDFDVFDRYGFIKHFINPLYAKLLHIQNQLQIETRELTSSVAFSVNYQTESIFDTDFLNAAYYSKYSSAGNPEKREELGKLLFFDPILSQNNERACASCHNPEMAFSDGQNKSISFDKTGQVDRNSPGLINTVFNTRFFWDVRASTPEDQIEHVLFSEKEFNTNYDEMIGKLNSCQDYDSLFQLAYPELVGGRNPIISRYTIVASISAYLQSLRSFNSEFDKSIRVENSETNQRLQSGFNLFAGKGKCATCHFLPTFAGNVPPLYQDTETEVLGVPSSADQTQAELDQDKGRFGNGRPKEKADFNAFSFKTPTLRNVELTSPYMHNGVFPTLREVVEFYNVGGGHNWGNGIAPPNATLAPDSLHLTESEIDDLILFMESLTDTMGLTAKPNTLPKSTALELNTRKIGGVY